jgi:hypothetical protein
MGSIIDWTLTLSVYVSDRPYGWINKYSIARQRSIRQLALATGEWNYTIKPSERSDGAVDS